MKSRILFFILAFIVLASLATCGFLTFATNSKGFFIIEGITLLSTIIFITLYRKLIKPYQLLTNSMELIKEQDFSIRLRSIPNSEANKLIEIFNKMMDQLRNERIHVREKNHFLDLLIQASPQGVIILDFNNRVTTINPNGLRLLKLKSVADIEHKKLSEVVNNTICQQLSNLTEGGETIIRVGGITQYRCTVSSFLDRGATHPFILIEEITHELFNTEKQSYENIIRLMAHEVNNSIGAIGSTLSVVNDICTEIESDQLSDLVPAVTASHDRCIHLSTFVKNFAEVVKIPEPTKTETNINRLLTNIVQLNHIQFRKRNIEVVLDLSAQDLIISADPIQLDQVFINIIKNAYEAINYNGIISITTSINPQKIEIKNNGPELSKQVQEKLFTPFFTTKKQGQGIGLMFIREVLLTHNYDFNFYSKDGWTIFEINCGGR